MLGMIGFGGRLNLTFCGFLYDAQSLLLSLFCIVLYKNIGVGNFDGYEKLEAALR